ncbi:MAG: VCBS repeat-containing protein [Gammaproteobacteria bacterium]|nr:MAG: VCBS repeat-containing protein [Gammaproteobacteria bacterium]
MTKDPVYDFNGSGTSDILWRNSSTGQNVLWLMNGATVASAPALPTVTNLNWIIAGAGDFNGDGKADILWHNQSTGQSQIWFMNGGTLTSAADTSTVSDTHWRREGRHPVAQQEHRSERDLVHERRLDQEYREHHDGHRSELDRRWRRRLQRRRQGRYPLARHGHRPEPGLAHERRHRREQRRDPDALGPELALRRGG